MPAPLPAEDVVAQHPAPSRRPLVLVGPRGRLMPDDWTVVERAVRRTTSYLGPVLDLPEADDDAALARFIADLLVLTAHRDDSAVQGVVIPTWGVIGARRRALVALTTVLQPTAGEIVSRERTVPILGVEDRRPRLVVPTPHDVQVDPSDPVVGLARDHLFSGERFAGDLDALTHPPAVRDATAARAVTAHLHRGRSLGWVTAYLTVYGYARPDGVVGIWESDDVEALLGAAG